MGALHITWIWLSRKGKANANWPSPTTAFLGSIQWFGLFIKTGGTLMQSIISKIISFKIWLNKKKSRNQSFNVWTRLKWWPESGLMQFWKFDNQVMRGIDECRLPVDRSMSSKNGDDRKVITLENLSGPFLFLIFGISVSFLVFLFEILYYNYKTRRTAITTLSLYAYCECVCLSVKNGINNS